MRTKILFIIYCAIYNNVNATGAPNNTHNTTNNTNNTYLPTWKDLDTRPLPLWYDSAKIGIFLQWNIHQKVIYSDNDAFWLRWRSGDTEVLEAADFVDDSNKQGFVFKANQFDAEEWAQMFAKFGARYIVLSTKNPHGFTMFPSGRPTWNSVDSGPKKDILGLLSESVRRYGVKFGIHYTLAEGCNKLFKDDMGAGTTEYIDKIVWADIQLLVNNYKPSVLWADGDEEKICGSWPPCSYWKAPKILAWLYNESPVRDEIVVNDRWCSNTRYEHGDVYELTESMNSDKEKNYTEKKLTPHKMEHVFSILCQNLYYRTFVNPDNVVTFYEILYKVVSTVSHGGNALIKIEPTTDGIILPVVQERLVKLGNWLKNNGEAIYNTTPWIYQKDSLNPDAWYTCREKEDVYNHTTKVVYIIFLKWPDDDMLKIKDVAPYLSVEGQIQMINPVLEEQNNGNEAIYVQVTYQYFDEILEVNLSSPNIVLNDMDAWVLKIEFTND